MNVNNNDEKEALTIQYLALEALFWVLAYRLFFAGVMRPTIFKLFGTSIRFDDVKKRSGTMMKNMADEVPLLFTLGTHHTFGGSMMLIGSLTGNSNLWLHGALMEFGFELLDLIFVLLGVDIYATGAVKPESNKVAVLHHLPGVLLFFPLMLNGYHTSHHLQQIGAWLLLAGGITLLVNGFIQTLDFSTHMPLVAFAQTSITAFVTYTRVWIFPKESYAFFNELQETGASKALMIGCGIAVAIFSLFNVALFVMFAEKSIRYTKRAITGISTPSSLKKSSPSSISDEDEKEQVPAPAMYGKIIAVNSRKLD